MRALSGDSSPNAATTGNEKNYLMRSAERNFKVRLASIPNRIYDQKSISMDAPNPLTDRGVAASKHGF